MVVSTSCRPQSSQVPIVFSLPYFWYYYLQERNSRFQFDWEGAFDALFIFINHCDTGSGYWIIAFIREIHRLLAYLAADYFNRRPWCLFSEKGRAANDSEGSRTAKPRTASGGCGFRWDLHFNRR